MRQAFFLIVILSSLSVVYSQHNDLSVTDEGDSIATPKPVMNAVKTDVFSWIFGTGVLKYERAFSETISAQLVFFIHGIFLHTMRDTLPPDSLLRRKSGITC